MRQYAAFPNICILASFTSNTEIFHSIALHTSNVDGMPCGSAILCGRFEPCGCHHSHGSLPLKNGLPFPLVSGQLSPFFMLKGSSLPQDTADLARGRSPWPRSRGCSSPSGACWSAPPPPGIPRRPLDLMQSAAPALAFFGRPDAPSPPIAICPKGQHGI